MIGIFAFSALDSLRGEKKRRCMFSGLIIESLATGAIPAGSAVAHAGPYKGIALSAVFADDAGTIGARAAAHLIERFVADFHGSVLFAQMDFFVLVHGRSSLHVLFLYAQRV